MKIVSLLPSATEILCEIGLQDKLVGVTHECNYPPSVMSLPKVTTTLIPKDASSKEIDQQVNEYLAENAALYSLNMDVLESLQPDLIVTQALCDVCAVAESEVNAAACTLPGAPRVVNLEPMSLQDVYDTITLVGEETQHQAQAAKALKKLQQREHEVRQRSAQLHETAKPTVGFLEWIDPPFNAGHWTPELIAHAGGIDVLGNLNQPSETTAWERVLDADPDVLFIAICGFDLERTLIDMKIMASFNGYDQLKAVRTNRVYVTDGNAYFSRSGPRLIDSLEIMAHALHPNLHPAPPFALAAIKYQHDEKQA